MKVLFLFQGLPHYYNGVLNRINQLKGVELVNVVPSEPRHMAEGVYQTSEGIRYRLRYLEEEEARYGFFRFRKLPALLLNERPQIVVTTDAHLRQFAKEIPVRLVMNLIGAKLILKSNPFLMPRFDELEARLSERRKKDLSVLSPRLAKLQGAAKAKMGLAHWGIGMLVRGGEMIRRLKRESADNRYPADEKKAWCFPDAHVNYTYAAGAIIESYGVPREKIIVTYNSPDTDVLFRAYEEVQSKGIVRHRHRIIHVGRLAEWKRVDLLIKAVAALKSDVSDIELIVVGDGQARRGLEEMAKSQGVAERVRFAGGVYDPSELATHCMSSAIYVLAGMGGLSINEAMCFGLPVVCSVCDGTEKYLVREGLNGRFFKDGDLDSLVGVMRELLADDGYLQRMGAESRRIIMEEINIGTVVEGYRRAFEYVHPLEEPRELYRSRT